VDQDQLDEENPANMITNETAQQPISNERKKIYAKERFST